MNEKRFVITLFGLAVAATVGFIAYRFIAAITVAVFLYYTTRRFYYKLERFRLPARIRAVAALSIVGLPLLALLSSTIVLLLLEARRLLEAYPVAESVGGEAEWVTALAELSDPTVDGLIAAYRAGDFDPILELLGEHASLLTTTITGFLLNLLIVVIITYYLLLDGSKFHEWLLRFDDEAIARRYLEAADAELEAVLYGNLLNVIAISIIAVTTYVGYNLVAPAGVQVPYPALAGALTGIASLIPVVGMKIVYLPLAGAAAVTPILNNELALLVYIAGFLTVAVVVVDTIPDIVLRPYFSGKTTHVGLLMLAYVFGPVVFGFHGLFLAPIVLVLGLTFVDSALPRLLGVEPESDSETLQVPPAQRRLDEFR